MILVVVDQLFLSNMGFVMLLRKGGDERAVPIFIGAAEAQAIAIQMQGVQIPRPLTHDLLKNFMDLLECRLKRVEICDIQEGTYFGKLIVEVAGQETEIDCRPSDAVALALRSQAPIYVHERVMQEAGQVLASLKQDPEAHEEDAGESGSAPTEPRSPLELLNRKLERAVRQERYEDAARLRDEIQHLKKHKDN